ncbi:equilibrative nucleotide transporter 8-like isoform X2 [Coffea arabica]|uniref:Equilibrative nucleotide transporter 8-like isoform X2 n=1 Tax=Coffea arabica TaxID=13443 RepID=A0A6P6SIQ6_COFAR|nr:equilibrative nucleotide transporter 8-like isoform X2 [Coffea arabica]
MEEGQMESSKGNNDQSEPRDTYRIAYILHFFLGAGNLLPWNTLITAIDYYSYIYPNRHVEKVFSVAYMSSSVLVLVVMLSWGKWSNRFNLRFRMSLGFSLFVFSLMVTPTMDWTRHSNGTKVNSSVSYYMIVSSVVICGLADGLIAGSLIGSAGKLPKRYMQAIFAGTASSVCSNLLDKLPVMQQHYKHLQKVLPHSTPKFWKVARIIRWPALGVFMIYTVTLSIFPGFLAENIDSRFLRDWYPIMLITLYNISDLVGKSFTAIFVVQGIGKVTWGCIARLLFYPLFSVCLHGPKWLKSEVPVALLTVMLGLTNGYLTSCIMILAPKAVAAPEAEIAAIVMVVFLGIGLVAGSVLGWFWLI